MNTGDLVEFLCEGLTDEPAASIARWIAESRRFQAFAADNRAKIRKKLRTATTGETLRSLMLELDVAHKLLAHRRCEVEYERYGQGRVRSPDLTVTFRTRTSIHVEVTQIQNPGPKAGSWDGKLVGIVCHKLGQVIPESINVL